MDTNHPKYVEGRTLGLKGVCPPNGFNNIEFPVEETRVERWTRKLRGEPQETEVDEDLLHYREGWLEGISSLFESSFVDFRSVLFDSKGFASFDTTYFAPDLNVSLGEYKEENKVTRFGRLIAIAAVLKYYYNASLPCEDRWLYSDIHYAALRLGYNQSPTENLAAFVDRPNFEFQFRKGEVILQEKYTADQREFNARVALLYSKGYELSERTPIRDGVTTSDGSKLKGLDECGSWITSPGKQLGYYTQLKPIEF